MNCRTSREVTAEGVLLDDVRSRVSCGEEVVVSDAHDLFTLIDFPLHDSFRLPIMGSVREDPRRGRRPPRLDGNVAGIGIQRSSAEYSDLPLRRHHGVDLSAELLLPGTLVVVRKGTSITNELQCLYQVSGNGRSRGMAEVSWGLVASASSSEAV